MDYLAFAVLIHFNIFQSPLNLKFSFFHYFKQSLLHFSSPLKNHPSSTPKDSTLMDAFLDGKKL